MAGSRLLIIVHCQEILCPNEVMAQSSVDWSSVGLGFVSGT